MGCKGRKSGLPGSGRSAPLSVCRKPESCTEGVRIGGLANGTAVYKYDILYTMSEQNARKLNHLEKELPEGLLVDAAWLEKHGYYGSLRKKYVDLGWLEQPAHRVYRRPRGTLSWEQAVISLQTLLEVPVV